MAENKAFKEALDSLFQGMNGVISSKTVVGEAIHIGDTILLPLVDVSFGMGAGAFDGTADNGSKKKGGGGLGGKISPCAVLVIQNGHTKLVNIKNQDTVTKILDMVPEVIDKLKEPKKETVTEEDIVDMLDKAQKDSEE